MDVYFVAADDLEIIDIRVVFDAGSVRDGDLPGLALLTGHMLKQGAAGQDADQISAAFEDQGARFSISVNRDYATLNLRSLSEPKNLSTAIQTMADVLRYPDFPEEDLERERNRLLVAIQQRKQSPEALAKEAFYATLYSDHPYGNLPGGTEESVTQIRKADLEHFHQQHYTRMNAKLIIVGAVDRIRVEQITELLFAALPKGNQLPPIPSVSPPPVIHKYVPHPSTQTHILMGLPVLKMDSPDRIPLFIAGRILGGGMISRLFRSVREERGLAYSVYSYFQPMAQAGPFVVGAQTQIEKKEETLQILRRELSAFAEDGPTAEELEGAKKNLKGGFPLNISSNNKVADYLVWMAFYGLPPDYLDSFISRVEGTTLEQVRESFKRHIIPDDLVIVEVGSRQEDSAD